MRPGRGNRRVDFTDLYNQSFPYVYSYIFARTAGSRQLTEEIVQETYTAAWLSLNSFRHESTWRTWLCSIAKNKLRESYRKAAYREKFQEPYGSGLDELPDGTDLETIVHGHETRCNVLRVLEAMNPLYRYVLIMKYMDGARVKEIAGVLDRSSKAVDGILQRAKMDFKKVYGKLERLGSE